jgi:hypothetical protein
MNRTNSSFQDILRRAIGIPPAAEREAAASEAAKQHQELEKDQPRRQALVEHFNKSVAPIIERAFSDAQEPLQEAGMRIDQVSTFTTDDVLIQRSFLISLVGGTGRVQVVIESYQIPSLNFNLLSSGKVTISVPDPSATRAKTPLLPVEFKPRSVPVTDMAADHVLAAFRDYITACAAKIR